MNKKTVFIFWGILALIFFVLYSLIIKKLNLYQTDFNLTVRLQNHIPKSYDMFLSYLSLMGSFELLTILLVAIILITRKVKSVLLLIVFAGAHVVELLGKLFLNHPGPPFMFFRYDLGFYFPSSYVSTGSSYPSGHSFRSVYLSVVIAYFIWSSKHLSSTKKIALSLALVAFNILMLTSRISLGEHWTSDVIGGMLLGVGFGLLSLPVLMPWRQASSK